MSPASQRQPDLPTQASIMEEAGHKLKHVRERLNLRFRDVEEASIRIANVHASDEYIVTLSRLADIENKGVMPTLYRLYSLCAIYRLDPNEVLSWYGISIASLATDSGLAGLPKTALIGFHAEEGDAKIPLSLDPGLDVSKTVFLSRLIQKWGTVPLMLLNQLDLKNLRYGLIGTEDWSMFPIIPPGSLVVIDDTKRKLIHSGWNNEYERPIYFFEHHGGYACGWCSVKDGRLILQPHPASNCDPQIFAYPGQIELVGRVTRVAMSLDHAQRRRAQS
jgi:transcriptional regulator with XRE-family HTH domain